jgi:NAD+ kinase
MKIAIYSREVKKENVSFVKEMFLVLEKHNIEIIVCKTFSDFLKNEIANSNYSIFSTNKELKGVDYLFSIGGDGTLLETITLIRDANIPVLGINTGRLGYLSAITIDKVNEAVTNLIQGDFELDSRTLLSLKTKNDFFGETNYALNEVTVQKKIPLQ